MEKRWKDFMGLGPLNMNELIGCYYWGRRLVLVVVLCLCSGRMQAAEEAMAQKAARLDALVTRYQECGFLNGAVLVAEHGKVLYAKGVGEANMETHTRNTPQTRFGIASITKQFTAMLVLQQVAKGTIRLDSSVCDYLPWYRKDTGQQMTVEQLVHHTAGLPPDYDSPQFGDSTQAIQHYEPEEFARKFCQPDLIAKPGTKWAYSNGGYVLLGLILERATGKPFAELLNEQILGPLGMKNTGITSQGIRQFTGAVGYTRHAGPRYTVGPNLDQGHGFSAGAMYSTVEDLLVWNQALTSGTLLPPQLQELVFKPGLGNWGYGWFVSKIGQGAAGAGNTVAEMRGDMPGNYFAWTLRYPEQDTVVIVLRNGYGSTERFEDKVQGILFGQQPQLPHRNPKDVVAHAWLVTYGFVNAHRGMCLVLLVVAIAGCCYVLNRKSRGEGARGTGVLRHAN